MTKFATLEKKYSKAQAGISGIKADIEKLKAQRDKLETEAQSKAEAGDTAGYTESKAAAEKVNTELYVKEQHLKAAEHPITKDEAQAAWQEYAKKAEKELENAWEKYTEERLKLADSFRAVMAIQDETRQIREKCATFVAKDPTKKTEVYEAQRDFACHLLTRADVMHDTLYFSRLDIFNLDEQIHYNAQTVDYRLN